MEAWPFDQQANVAAVTSGSVMEGAPILLVVHYSDDHSWAFLDGLEFDTADALLVRMDNMLTHDPTLAGIANLPPGWVATRESAAAPWVRAADPEI